MGIREPELVTGVGPGWKGEYRRSEKQKRIRSHRALKTHNKKFGYYSKGNMKPVEDFEWKSDMLT